MHKGGYMATLNIKNVPDRLYRKIQARANKNHRSIPQEVVHILTEVIEESEPLSILDLQGLGKELWHKTSSTRHVRDERRRWD
jgi:plasmid stability protein